MPGGQSLDAPLAGVTGPFRAVTINWAYRPEVAGAPDPITSALVVPVLENDSEIGTLAAYAPQSGAFGPDDVQALESLARDAGPALAAARRFAGAQRELTDTVTGLRNSSGYEDELERAVSRARETGRSLSLLILSGDQPEDPEADAALQELAALLVRTTRATDVVCRRRAEQFGILLPDTAGDPARRVYGRLLEAATRESFRTTRQLTFASGLVEWRPNESSEALDARALAAVGQTRTEPLALAAVHAEPHPGLVAPSLRSTFEERLGREIDRARHLERPLTVLAARVDGIRRIEEAHGATAAERVLEEVEARLREVLGSGDSCAQIDVDELVVILSGSESGRAEIVFSAFRASLERDPATHLDRLAVSAGITVLAASDDTETVLDRAEHALERASRAGLGTVVVAMAADDAQR
jgi:diguanylate cyclase (GGDEF)-like protein